MNKKPFLLALLATFIYLIFAFLTLKNYGISWDETLHFQNGQAFLHLFLTGKTDYKDLPSVNLQGTNGDPNKVPQRRSFYESDIHDGKFFLITKPAHPVINDELAALSNWVFYQKLGVIDDISAHHLFNILASSIAIFSIVYFASITFGYLTGTIAFLSIITYPLFWSESHFNIKDPPETAFFAMSILAFYKALDRFSIKWQIIFWIFFTLALGTKFNIFFIVFILLPYLFYRYKGKMGINLKSSNLIKNLIVISIFGLLLSITIFFLSWPTLWSNFPLNILSAFQYYKEVGTGARYQPENFFILGFNFYPLLWILFTTPPIILVLFALGLISCFINRNKYKGVTILWLLWLVVPIFRVMIPGTDIYGGDRQIMEFLPALALISGLGAYQILEFIKNRHSKRITLILLVLSFMWPAYILYKLHPNENVYFNNFIGGLPGAMSRNFPAWGNSFGNAYLQGINWINKNSPQNSKLALIQGTASNAPAIFLRKDINYSNSNWSGIERKGEYLMELTFNDTTKTPGYAWEYVDKFLIPVYELKVDGVAILKIWKNDLAHTKDSLKLNESEYKGQISINTKSSQLIISLEDRVLLSRLQISLMPSGSCNHLSDGYIETSVNGKNWVREIDQLPSLQKGYMSNLSDNSLEFWFAGRNAKYIRLTENSNQNCSIDNFKTRIYVLQ